MSTFWHDIRYSFHQLRKSPAFTTVAILSLALGIGANTAIFSVINAVLLRPLPFKDADRLVTVWERNPEHGYDLNAVAAANFKDWQRQNQSFEEMALFGLGTEYDITIADNTTRVVGYAVTADLFSMLGVTPWQGRVFTPQEEIPDQPEVIVINHTLWQQHFGEQPSVLGKDVILDGRHYQVIGVMPPEFVFPGATGEPGAGTFFNPLPDFWMPLTRSVQDSQNRGEHHLQVIARLKPGVTIDQARQEMDFLQGQIRQTHAGVFMGTHCTLLPLREQSIAAMRLTLWVLLGAVGCVLLIACSNIANLYLVRATARQREFAVRIALGAGRTALIRQLLTESLIVALLGGLLGVWIGWGGGSMLAACVGGNVAAITPGWNDIAIDGRVLVFTLVVSLGTGILFGLMPAWQATRTDVQSALKKLGRGVATAASSHRLRCGLVVGEVAMAMMLLVGAGLLLQSFTRLQQVHPGFNPEQLLTFQLGLPEVRYPHVQQRNALVEQLTNQLTDLPGVESAGATTILPLAGDAINNRTYTIVGRPPLEPGKFNSADLCFITPDYLHTMQVPLSSGRYFNASDASDAPYVCLINRALAQRQFPHEDPIGHKIHLVTGGRDMEIVGVIQDVKRRTLNDTILSETEHAIFDNAIYMPYAQEIEKYRSATSMVLRTRGDPMALVEAVSRMVRELDPQQPLARLKSMESLIGATVARPRFRALLIGLFGGLALILAVIGLYGVLAYTVSQRTGEIGIRLALGAQRSQVLSLVLNQGMTLVLAGIALGLIGAVTLGRFIASLLYGVTPTDPVALITVSLTLIAVGLLACLIPARRAAKTDPMEALRYE